MLRLTNYRHLIRTCMIMLVLLLEFFKFSAIVTYAQTVGSTVYVNSASSNACRPVEVPPFGTIPSSATLSQEACQQIQGSCPSSGVYTCVADETSSGETNLTRYYCPNPGGQWQRVSTPCTADEQARISGTSTCNVSGGYRCIKAGTGFSTSYQRYFCPSVGANWSRTTLQCSDAEILSANASPDGISEAFLEENNLGEFLVIPNTKPTIVCDQQKSAEGACVNGYFCQKGTDELYDWELATSSETNAALQACFEQRSGYVQPTLVCDSRRVGACSNGFFCHLNASREYSWTLASTVETNPDIDNPALEACIDQGSFHFVEQNKTRCDLYTENVCINGVLCRQTNSVYSWITARPSTSDFLSQSCYEQRPFNYAAGEELPAGERRCPMNAVRCECTGVAYEVTYGVGETQVEYIGPGERCGGIDQYTPNVISAIELYDGSTVARNVDSVARNADNDAWLTNTTAFVEPYAEPYIRSIINNQIEYYSAIFGEEAVKDYLVDAYDPNTPIWWTDPRNYLRHCSAQAMAENGRGTCFNVAGGIGLGAGVVVDLGVAAVAALGGGAVLSQTAATGSLISAGVTLETATFLTTFGSTIIGGGLTLYAGGGVLNAAIQNSGSFISPAVQTTFTYLDEVITFGAQSADDFFFYRDGIYRSGVVGNELLTICANGQASTGTISKVRGAVTTPIYDLVAGNAVDALTSNPAETIQNCIYNINGQQNTGTGFEIDPINL